MLPNSADPGPIPMDPRLDIHDFNEKGELKAPFGLLLSLLFLSRHFLFLLLGGLSEYMTRGRGFDMAALGLPPAWTLLTDLPPFVFFLLLLRREKLPAGGLLRRILGWGLPLLLTLGVLQLLLTALSYAVLPDPGPLRMADMAMLVLCVVYLASNWKLRLFFRGAGAE